MTQIPEPGNQGPTLGELLERQRDFLRNLYEDLELGRFAGREELVGQIRAAIDSGARNRGYILIKRVAGWGKTTLVAHLVSETGWVSHFSRTFQGRDPEFARQNLAGQLIEAWELSGSVGPGGVLSSKAFGKDSVSWFHTILNAAAKARDRKSPGRPIVLVVDGLDEMEGDPLNPTRIPLGLPEPAQLPANVFIIATCRTGRLSEGLESVLDPAEVEKTSEEVQDSDMREYVAARAGEKKLAGALQTYGVSLEGFTNALLTRCDHLWLYLRLVLTEIEQGKRRPDDLESLPPKLTTYYTDQMHGWERQDVWKQIGLPTTAALVACTEATLADLTAVVAKVNNLPEAEIELKVWDWLESQLRAFVNFNSASLKYSLLHSSFSEPFAPNASGAKAHGIYHEALRRAHSARTDLLLPAQYQKIESWKKIERAELMRLARHAARAGRMNELLDCPGFLLADKLQPSSVLSARRFLEPHEIEAAAAINAYEAMRERRKKKEEERAWWLHVEARKNHADRLATAAGRLSGGSLLVHAAMWTGSSGTVLPAHIGSSSRSGRGSSVTAMAVFSSGSGSPVLVTAGADGHIRLWGSRSGGEISDSSSFTALTEDPLVRAHERGVRAVAPLQSAGRTRLVSGGGDGAIRFWDPSSEQIKQPVWEIRDAHRGAITGIVALSKEHGHMVATSGGDRAVRFWTERKDQLGRELQHTERQGPVHAMATLVVQGDRSGWLVTAGKGGTLYFWSDGDEPEWELPSPDHSEINVLATVPGGNGHTWLVAGGQNGVLRCWDLADPKRPTAGRVWERLDAHRAAVSALTAVADADGRVRLVSGGTDGRVRFWSLEDGKDLGSLTATGTSQVTSLAAIPLNSAVELVAVGGSDGTVRLREIGAGPDAVSHLSGHQGAVNTLAALPLLSGVSVVASGGDDHHVRLWDPQTGTEVLPAQQDDSKVMTISPVPLSNGHVLLATSTEQRKVILWRPPGGDVEGEWTELAKWVSGDPVGALRAALLNRGTTLLAASDGPAIRLRELTLGGEWDTDHLPSVIRTDDGVTRLSTDDHWGEEEELELMTGRLGNGPPLLRLRQGIAVSAITSFEQPRNLTMLAMGAADGTVHLLDLLGRPKLVRLPGRAMNGIRAVTTVTDKNGRILLAAGGKDSLIHLWVLDRDRVGGTGVGVLHAAHGEVNAVAEVTTRSGRKLLASGGGNGKVCLWDVELPADVDAAEYYKHLDPIAERHAHTKAVMTITALPSHDEHIIMASGGKDGAVFIWTFNEEREPNRKGRG